MTHWLKKKAFRTWVYNRNELKTIVLEVQTGQEHEAVANLAFELRANEDELS